jgi:hypothetical protein
MSCSPSSKPKLKGDKPVKKFNQTYDLHNRESIKDVMDKVGETHAAIQKLEAGIEGTTIDKAEATFLFLNLIGYYPNQLLDQFGKTHDVYAKGLRSAGGSFFVDFIMDTDTDTATYPLLGPGIASKELVLSVKDLTEIIKLGFPKVVIQMTTGVSKSGQTVYHTTVRPAFMQPEDANGFPIESGSAECSNGSVSLMQATTRMIAVHAMGAMTARLAVELKTATAPKTKTLAEIARQKYGVNLTDLVSKKYTEPNALFNILFKDQPDPSKNGVYSVKPGDWWNSSVRSPEAKAACHAASYNSGILFGGRSVTSELQAAIDRLKKLGIEVKIVG